VEKTQVVIIGGGATGTGILWDLALRGVSAVLFEQGDLGHGATGRCHGLLHSGGRYVVKDVSAAQECIAENRIIKKIAPACVEDTGGLFVEYEQDDPGYAKEWLAGCRKAGIPTDQVSPSEACDLEPTLPSAIRGAYTVPDAHINPFLLTFLNCRAAISRGARLKTYTEITSIKFDGNRAVGVRYRDLHTGEEAELACEVIISAAGPWADKVGSLAHVSVPVRCDRGSLVILNQRFNYRVINRCRKPGDGDIVVPGGTVSILGTTSVTVSGPEDLSLKDGEVNYLLRLGSELIPAIGSARVLRVFSGTRPLYAPKSTAGAGGREISRGFALLDHAELEGIEGFVSIVGGKLTTYRLMAQVTVDLICRKLAIHESCQTDHVPLQAPVDRNLLERAAKTFPEPILFKLQKRLGPDLAQVLKRVEEDPAHAELVCDCEFVTRGELSFVLDEGYAVPARTLSDVGRRTRMGFGTCQGTYCGYGTMLEAYGAGKWSDDEARLQLRAFLDRRWKGQDCIPHGKQTEQLNLSRDLHEVAFNLAKTGD
jgi:glycerol-3-phosphate dehydrogenase